MRVHPTPLAGVYLIEPRVFSDQRELPWAPVGTLATGLRKTVAGYVDKYA